MTMASAMAPSLSACCNSLLISVNRLICLLIWA
jgi:hypothetical protein